MDFMEGSTWYWNDWRDVEFREDYTFYAPDGNCDNGECTWRTEGGFIVIDCFSQNYDVTVYFTTIVHFFITTLPTSFLTYPESIYR